jgi:hypothetical protein
MHEVKSSIPNPNSMEITHMITEVKRKFPQIVEDYLDDIIIYLRKIEVKINFKKIQKINFFYLKILGKI